MKLSQEKIDKIYKIFQWITFSILVGGFILLVLLPIGKSKWSWGIWFGLFLVSAIIANVVKRWATDEEAEEFKKAVKDAFHEFHEEDSQKKRRKPSQVPSPLIGLSDEKEKVVICLLNKIGEISGHIKTADLKNLLHALANIGALDDSDLEQLVDWVEEKTGKIVEEAKFKNEYVDIYRRNGKKEKDWELKIQKEFNNLR